MLTSYPGMVSIQLPTLLRVSCAALLLAHPAFSYPKWATLPSIDVPAPRCDGSADFNVASEYFVEIANPLPGREEYNQLVGFFEKKSWAQFEEHMAVFQKAFETSPLREAAAFLEAQAMISQADTSEEASIKAAEKKVREVLLLYPKSKLVPVLLLDTANLHLSTKNFSKALAFFEGGRQDYPFHELSCRFLLGIGESNYLLRDEKTSKQVFQSVLQKCQDPLARLVAEIRTADLEFPSNMKKSLAIYSDKATRFPVRLAKYTPWALFNAGEAKFQAREYPSARYFFSEFIKYQAKNECSSWAMKRIGDVTVRLNRPLVDGVGAFLAVYDKFPSTEVGKFSRLHGFLLELPTLPEPEVERRLKVFDADIDKITDDSLRTLLFLEKGLSLLSRNEKGAINYLVRFDERRENFLKDPSVATLVRGGILHIIQTEIDLAAKRQKGKDADGQIFEPLEKAYGIWFKGTAHEAKAKGLYQKLILSRMRELLEKDNPVAALERLERWQTSGIWDKSGPPKEAHSAVATAFLRSFQIANDEQRKEFAKVMVEKEKVLSPFLKGDLQAVWLVVWMESGDKAKVKAALGDRNLASLSPDRSAELKGLITLVKGKAARFIKKYDQAESYLSKIEYPSLKTEGNLERFEVARDLEKPEKMLQLTTLLETHLSNEEYMKTLEDLAQVVTEKKRWDLAEPLYERADKSRRNKEQILPFLTLKGRASFERGNYKKAIEQFETAITISPDLDKRPDIKFRLGKSYYKTKQRERAVKQWEALAQLKDESWSPLAENELKLIEKK